MPGYELIGAEERQLVNEVFDRGGVLFRHGFESQRGGLFMVRDFERLFAAKMRTKHALAVSSGTAGLRVALAALGIGPGDEVITQSFTFVATVEAIIESGASPKCANVDNSLNLDPTELDSLVSEKTKAVIAVHMLGTPAEVRILREFCDERGLFLIEDTAWGCGGSLGGRPLGTWGDVGVFSFDHAKAITTGEGGMLVTSDQDLFNRAAAWHDHGHENNPSVPRWEDTRSSSGFNFRMSEIQGAVGIAQLAKLDSVVAKQREHYETLSSAISKGAGVSLRPEPAGSFATYDALVVSLPSKNAALYLRDRLVTQGLSTKILPEAMTWHFAGDWNHMPQLVSAHHQNLSTDLATSREILEKCVALPLPFSLTEEQIETIAFEINSVRGR